MKAGGKVLFSSTRARGLLSRRPPGEGCDGMSAALEPRWQGRLGWACLLAPALLWLGALIVLPHVDLAVLSLRERVGPRHYVASLAQYRTFFAEPLYWHVFVRTAVMSVVATFLTLVLAFPIAWIIAKVARGRASSLLFMLCLIPFWVSETVRTLGWMILLRESGVLPALLVKLGITPCPSSSCITMPPSWWGSSTPRSSSW